MRAMVLGALLALGGCLAAPGPAPSPTSPPSDAWGGANRQTLVNVTSTGSEFDVLCVSGGAPELPRQDGRVLPGSHEVELTAEVDLGFTGIQLGYALDGGEVTWLGPPLASGSATWSVRVEPEQWEPLDGSARWAFYVQMNVSNGSGAVFPCYTGGGAGTYTVLVEAVRSPSPSG